MKREESDSGVEGGEDLSENSVLHSGTSTAAAPRRANDSERTLENRTVSAQFLKCLIQIYCGKFNGKNNN